MIIFEGETHLVDVELRGPVEISGSLYASDASFRAVELLAGSFNSVWLTTCDFSDDLTLNGGSNFQQVMLANLSLNTANLIVVGDFEYGFVAEGVLVRSGQITLTSLENFSLGCEVLQGFTPYAVSLTDCDGGQLKATLFEAQDGGVILTTSDLNKVEVNITSSGRHGVQITDSNKNRIEGIVTDAGRDTTNTYDGVFVSGNSDRNRTSLTVAYQGAGNQMRYGMNLSAATINDHVEASILNGAGATGAFNDASTAVVLTDDHIV